MSRVIAPPQADGLLLVVSMSGGKDSTATALALREAGVPFRMVFADTGWEAPETYAHLDLLRQRLGPIDVVGHPGGYEAAVREHRGFSPSQGRWCTRVLKLKPLVAYHGALSDEDGRDTVCVVGVRAAESAKRSGLPAWERDRDFKTWTWRPILAWSVDDVLAIHHRHSIPVNPLYRRGHDRVGCYPCISADTKSELRLLAEHSPAQVDRIRRLEAEVAAMRAATPGPESPTTATFFREGGIDEQLAWARTAQGGRPAAPVPPRARGRMLPLGPLRCAGVPVTARPFALAPAEQAVRVAEQRAFRLSLVPRAPTAAERLARRQQLEAAGLDAWQARYAVHLASLQASGHPAPRLMAERRTFEQLGPCPAGCASPLAEVAGG